jgi:catechol 2,3-dioxygenase-like lactoylglutathione lyase family enzyme
MDLGWCEVALNVQDVTRSLAFYETLGFEIGGGVLEDRYVALHKDDCSITLYQGYGTEPLYLVFWQGDVRALASDFARKGIGFARAPSLSDDDSSFLLKDPDGHSLFFITQKKYDSNSPARAGDGRRVKARQYPPNKHRSIELGWFEISLPVNEMALSVDFYRKLGFVIVEDHDPRNVTLQSNDCRLSLYQGYLDPARPQLIFWQADVEAISSELTSGGLRFARGPASDEKGTGAMLFDPDGHPLYFVNIRGVVHKEPVYPRA